MSVLNLLPNNYEPVSNGKAEESPTTFSDVVSAGFASQRDNFNANASTRIIAELRDANFQSYEDIVGSKFNPSDFDFANEIKDSAQSVVNRFSDVNRSFMDKQTFATEKFDIQVRKLKASDSEKYAQLKTYDEIKEEARKRANMSRAEFENVASRADEDTAFYGSVVGSLGGALTDPINVLTMPLGAGAAGGVLRAIGTEAAIQAGVETVTQPTVYAWQKELGQEYDLGDAATNIFGAAVLGGGFAGVVRGARPTAQATFALMQKSSTFNSLQKQASGYLSRVAHFREANPNPKVASELHTDTVTAVNAVVRAGDNPSIANLPMTSKQFNEIDTGTRGLNDVQKQTINELQKFKDGISDIPQEAVEIVRKYDNFEEFSKDALSVENGFFDIPTSKQIARNERINEINQEIDAINLEARPIANKQTKTAQDKSTLEQLGLRKEALLNERNSMPSAPSIVETSLDIDAVNRGLKRVFDNVKLRDAEISKGEPVSPELAPSKIEEIPQPLTNREADELIKRLESIDNQKAQAENFRQLVESNADTVVTLEDGTTKTLRQLSEEFADDENFITEISTCAIG